MHTSTNKKMYTTTAKTKFMQVQLSKLKKACCTEKRYLGYTHPEKKFLVDEMMVKTFMHIDVPYRCMQLYAVGPAGHVINTVTSSLQPFSLFFKTLKRFSCRKKLLIQPPCYG